MLPKKGAIYIETLNEILRLVRRESGRQKLTTTKIFKLTSVRSLHTLYRYIRFACARGLMRVETVHDPRPYGAAKYYYVTALGERTLDVWPRRRPMRRKKKQ